MIRFGDAEPEDAWDASDPTPVLVDNLRRRVLIVLDQRRWDDHARARLELVAYHLAFLFRRLADDG